ncbi:hypothetical protein DES52_11726 [Deinococcus yavapaiensis KR-236]|uniref:Uncharacterized protein n=1 Tax=Deinococcus yavapaiensis KR-236 TaxID=694435 RepID=A0A318SDN1_9DEIO|nr:hypothetical protein DES52_11726 [Deinococcus yavapaiensis KR-236]
MKQRVKKRDGTETPLVQGKATGLSDMPLQTWIPNARSMDRSRVLVDPDPFASHGQAPEEIAFSASHVEHIAYAAKALSNNGVWVPSHCFEHFPPKIKRCADVALIQGHALA